MTSGSDGETLVHHGGGFPGFSAYLSFIPALPLSAFVGRYASDAFGTLDVSLRDGKIYVRNGVLESVAEVFDGPKNALRVELTPGSGGVLEFHATDGRITAVSFAAARLERVK